MKGKNEGENTSTRKKNNRRKPNKVKKPFSFPLRPSRSITIKIITITIIITNIIITNITTFYTNYN